MIAPSTEDDGLIAAELAFGLLDPAARRAAVARGETDAVFGACCAIWRRRAAALLDGDDVAPDPGTWSRIVKRLPANDRHAPEPLRRSIRRWRAATVATGLLAFGFAIGAVAAWRHRASPVIVAVAPVSGPTPILVILRAQDRAAIVSISFDRASGRIVTASDALHLTRNAAQLWVIPAGGKPRSLGLIPVGRQGAYPAPRAGIDSITAGATLAVSLEPIGGSPTGQPTGPVILTGTIA